MVTDFDDRVCHQYLCSWNEYRNIETKTLIESCSPGSNSDGSLVQLSDCVVSSPEVAGINRQTLTLVQSLILPILYCTLVGADHLRYGAEELRNAFSIFSHLTMKLKFSIQNDSKWVFIWSWLKMRKRLKSIIVVMDLLDVLELQSCVWEGTTLCLGFTAECILYFYCYILERIYNFPLINRFLDI